MENTSLGYPWSFVPTGSGWENVSDVLSPSVPERAGSADLHIAMLVVQCVQSVLIFATNAVTILAIARQPQLQTNTNRFIASLCVADLLACLLPFLSLSRCGFTSNPLPVFAHSLPAFDGEKIDFWHVSSHTKRLWCSSSKTRLLTQAISRLYRTILGIQLKYPTLAVFCMFKNRSINWSAIEKKNVVSKCKS